MGGSENLNMLKDEDLLKEWEVKSNTTDLNLRTICMEIEMSEKNQGGINLKPFYQREYKFTRKDESLLIESLLAGIPIPTIYLASDTTKVPHVSNVIDGQHRLMSVYRFVNNKFQLTGLEKYKHLNDKRFYELSPALQNKLLYQVSLKLQFIHVQDNPELEIEIFTRYNKGTNPLTSQEIRNVVYGCEFNDWVNQLVKELMESKETQEIYNISRKRFEDKSIHEELYVLFAIYKYGIQEDYYSSTRYTELFMKECYKLNHTESILLIQKCKEYLYALTKFLKKAYYDIGTINPFSKEIYEKDLKFRNHKFQTSIMMIMIPVFNYLINSGIDLDNDEYIGYIREAIKFGFVGSGFNEVTSSTTRPALVKSTSEFIINKIEKVISEIGRQMNED